MDAAGDSERNDAAPPSSPISADPHHAALNRQMSSSKKSALTRTLDCDPDRNEFTIAMEYLHPEKFDSSTIPDSGTAGQTASQSRLRIEQQVAMIFESASPNLDSHLRHAEPIEPTKQLDDSVKAPTPIPDTLAINFRITDTANPQEPESHDMIAATVSAPSITSSCHVEPSLDERATSHCSESSHMSEPLDCTETIRGPDVESAPPQKFTATDSASIKSALPEVFLQDLRCSVCDHGIEKTRSGWFHCRQCSNGTFVLCRACYMNDEWCHGDAHTLDQWVFPVDEGEEVNMPDKYIPEFFFCVEKPIRRFRSAHTLPTCTTYSLLSPEDSILLDEERLKYRGSATSGVVEMLTTRPSSKYLFGTVRLTAQLTKSLQDLSITGFTYTQAQILRFFERTKNYDLDALVTSPINSGDSTAVLLGLIMKAAIRNEKAAAAYKSPEDFVQVQGQSCRVPFAIIVCPTQDLAIEIFRRAWYLCYNTNVKPVLSVGGNDNLTVGDILIGTIGKLTQIAKDRMTGPAQYMVIEEAFDMLEDNSLKNLHRLFYEYGAVDCHTQFWSLFGINDFYPDTGEKYEKLIGSMTSDNVCFSRYISTIALYPLSTSEHVHQHFFKVEDCYEDLVGRLIKTLYKNDEVRVVVFTETAEECEIVEDLLCRRIDDGFRKVRARDNNMTSRQQEFNVESLRRGKCQVLVTTGSLAPGVKIVNVTHIIHFRLPRHNTHWWKLFVWYLQRNGIGGVSNNRIISWAYYDEKDEKLFQLLAEHLHNSKQATSWRDIVEKFKNGETILPQ